MYVGEHQLDTDPTHLYAVLKPKTGKARIVTGGEPARSTPLPAALPVQIKLPDNQGWAVAAEGATLSYRYGDGQWSAPSTNALLIPHGADVEVQVQRPERTEIVAITPS